MKKSREQKTYELWLGPAKFNKNVLLEPTHIIPAVIVFIVGLIVGYFVFGEISGKVFILPTIAAIVAFFAPCIVEYLEIKESEDLYDLAVSSIASTTISLFIDFAIAGGLVLFTDDFRDLLLRL